MKAVEGVGAGGAGGAGDGARGRFGGPGARWRGRWAGPTEEERREGDGGAPAPEREPAPEPGTEPSPGSAPTDRGGAHPVVRWAAMLVAFAGMVVFAWLLARLTLEPSPASESVTYNNVRPGRSLSAYWNGGTAREAVRQIGGNLVLGVPFGVLLPVLLPRARGALRVVLCTAAVMFLVELVQGALVTGRAFDVDDVILNTTGALLGYLLVGRRLGRAVHPRRRHWWQRAARNPRPAPVDPAAGGPGTAV
ncbi:VanZ family protein [Streptomyces sp. BI20]|uniref:VanZ family protein n=1 Tax=Streptomyces sp. BI20 TaxID=3403460 RepID=UPI003C756420